MLELIDTEKTIELNKIYFIKGRISDFVNLIMMYGVGVIMLPAIAIGYEINHYDSISDDIMGSVFSILIPLLISAFMFLYLYTRKNLKRYANIDKNIIIEAVKELEWKLISDNQKYMIIEAGSYQRQISIIFDNKDLLVHSLRFGRYDFYFSETTKLEILMDKIKEIKNKNAVQHAV